MSDSSELSMQQKKKNLILIIGGVGILSLLIIVSIVARRQFTFRSRADGAAGMILKFNPAQVSPGASGEFTATIIGRPTTEGPVQGYVFGLNFDKSKLEVLDISYKAGVASAGLGDDNSTLAAANGRGYLKIQGEVRDTAGKLFSATADTDIVSLKFKSKSADANLIVLGSAIQPQFFKIASTNELSPVGATLEQLAINASGGSSGGSFGINFKFKLQGIVKKPEDQFNRINIKVTAVAANNDKKEGVGEFTADANGVWTGRVGFNGLTAGQGYKFLAKGPKHIQRKICDLTPTETDAGTYVCKLGNRVTITNDMTLDFSGVYLLVGDIPNQDNQQDGLVDSYDLSVIRNNLGKKDAAILRQCDLNFDGICDTQDFGLAIRALSVKVDEED